MPKDTARGGRCQLEKSLVVIPSEFHHARFPCDVHESDSRRASIKKCSLDFCRLLLFGVVYPTFVALVARLEEAVAFEWKISVFAGSHANFPCKIDDLDG